MAGLSLDQAARLTELGKTTITRAIKCSWLSARRKKDGSYEIDPGEAETSARRLNALTPGVPRDLPICGLTRSYGAG
jgi:hypothetical protein